jgi:beta-carotene ketolase (CrtW type)
MNSNSKAVRKAVSERKLAARIFVGKRGGHAAESLHCCSHELRERRRGTASKFRHSSAACNAVDSSGFNGLLTPYKCFGDVIQNDYESDFPSDPRQLKQVLERCLSRTSARKLLSSYSRDLVGILLAVLLFSAWCLTLPLMFSQPDAVMPNIFSRFSHLAASGRPFRLASIVGVMLARTWFTTGLFVTVHDAIHGQVSPNFRRLNHTIGSICAFCYASFSYKLLYRDHWQHHAEPVSDDDPDWYEGNFLRWILSFLGHYSTFWQLFWESFQFWTFVAIGQRLFHIEFTSMVVRVALIWALPALVSGIQLFYFGTYLPHKGIYPQSESSEFRARSNNWPDWLSLLSCFHFGACHFEHHAFPCLAWWELPAARRAQNVAKKKKKEHSKPEESS